MLCVNDASSFRSSIPTKNAPIIINGMLAQRFSQYAVFLEKLLTCFMFCICFLSQPPAWPPEASEHVHVTYGHTTMQN